MHVDDFVNMENKGDTIMSQSQLTHGVSLFYFDSLEYYLLFRTSLYLEHPSISTTLYLEQFFILATLLSRTISYIVYSLLSRTFYFGYPQSLATLCLEYLLSRLRSIISHPTL